MTRLTNSISSSLIILYVARLDVDAFVPKIITCAFEGKARRSSSRLSDIYSKANIDLKNDLGDELFICNGDTVDRAPCFDGICDSQPVESRDDPLGDSNSEVVLASNINTSAGGAIQRLGSMTGPTVWSEFGRISQEYEVANLGQGMFIYFSALFVRCIFVILQLLSITERISRLASSPVCR
jgi:hypothetical protein